MSIISELHAKVNSGMNLTAAIDQIVPGADPAYWQRRLANYDPAAKSNRRTARRKAGSSRRKKSTFAASQVLVGLAMVETVERVNGREVE